MLRARKVAQPAVPADDLDASGAERRAHARLQHRPEGGELPHVRRQEARCHGRLPRHEAHGGGGAGDIRVVDAGRGCREEDVHADRQGASLPEALGGRSGLLRADHRRASRPGVHGPRHRHPANAAVWRPRRRVASA